MRYLSISAGQLSLQTNVLIFPKSHLTLQLLDLTFPQHNVFLLKVDSPGPLNHLALQVFITLSQLSERVIAFL